MIWDDEFETLPREALEALQLSGQGNGGEGLFNPALFTRKKFDEQGLKPSDLNP